MVPQSCWEVAQSACLEGQLLELVSTDGSMEHGACQQFVHTEYVNKLEYITTQFHNKSS